jgi:magnesium chelatase family protein
MSVLTVALSGLQARAVPVSASSRPGCGLFDIAGMAPERARESRVRVRSALAVLGIDTSARDIAVEARGLGAGADLAIVAAVATELGAIPAGAFDGMALLGELSLAGDVRSIRGALPAVLGHDGTTVVPASNAPELWDVGARDVREIAHVRDLVLGRSLPVVITSQSSPEAAGIGCSMDEVRGNEAAKRGIARAVAEGRGLLLVGPTGSGKTMLARRAVGLMPPLAPEERREVACIYSVAGLAGVAGLARADGPRPFRAPHHTVSTLGLVGGGNHVRPGEVSLAHRGVLFLHELPEFRRDGLLALRSVLAEGRATIVRTGERVTFPAAPLILASATPCPCGVPSRCSCSAESRARFEARLNALRDLLSLDVVTTEGM